jgi:chemotaxis protein methyltransferase CheR
MTGFRSETLGIPAAGLPILQELVHERTGLVFDNGRGELFAERMAPLVVDRGFRSFLDLYYLLKYDDTESKQGWRQVLDALSVPETYFWREIDQVKAIVSRVVPDLVRRWPGVPLRIWSAPCASGEEPLTIAMALNEAGWFERAAIEIHGGDGSPSAIAKARSARYRPRSLRALPPALAEKYFAAADGGTFVAEPALTQRITSWSVVNLMDPEDIAPFARSPIVFCRNAFIYFSPQAIRQVVDRFAALMPTPGYLCVGASESLLNITNAFTLQEIDRAFVYVKRGLDD